MKFNCNGSDLAQAFNKVSKAISQKKNIPILEGVKIVANNDIITLTATDNEMTIINSISGVVIMAGEIVVDGKFTCELINKMGGNTIEMECLDGREATIKYLDSNAKIKCMSIDEFPPIMALEGEEIYIKNSEIKTLVDKISFSASNDEMRPILKGCLIKISGNKLQGVALDGFRLAIATSYLEREYSEIQAIVPAKAMFDMTRILDNNEEYAKITITKKKFMIDIGHTKIITTLLSGDFIKYESIIPKAFNTNIIVIRKQLEEVLGRVIIFSKRDNASLITLVIEENILTIKANTQQGNIVEKLPISSDGKDTVIGLNSKFLYDCIRAVDEEQIRISITNEKDPCVILPIEGDGFLYLILPIRIVV